MRTVLVLLLAFAASATAVSGSRDVDGGSISEESSTSWQGEMIPKGIAAAALREYRASPSSRKRLEINAAASAGNDGTFAGAESSDVSWSLAKIFEALAAAGINDTVPRENGDVPVTNSSADGANGNAPGTIGTIGGNNRSVAGENGTMARTKGAVVATNRSVAGTNGTITGARSTIPRANGTVAGTNVNLPANLFSPWSMTEILNGIALAIEYERKLRRATAGVIPSPPSPKGSSLPSTDGLAAGCASLVLGMAPCVMDIMESPVDSVLQKPSDPCCSAVLAISTPSAAGGAACACHLLRDPAMLDFQLKLDSVDVLFSACDGRHFTNGSFAKICQEAKTLPPLVMYLGPTPANITDSIHVPGAPPAAHPATNFTSREVSAASEVAKSMTGGCGRWLLLLTLLWSAFI